MNLKLRNWMRLAMRIGATITWLVFHRPAVALGLLVAVWVADFVIDTVSGNILSAFKGFATVPGCKKCNRQASVHMRVTMSCPECGDEIREDAA